MILDGMHLRRSVYFGVIHYLGVIVNVLQAAITTAWNRSSPDICLCLGSKPHCKHTSMCHSFNPGLVLETVKLGLVQKSHNLQLRLNSTWNTRMSADMFRCILVHVLGRLSIVGVENKNSAVFSQVDLKRGWHLFIATMWEHLKHAQKNDLEAW